MTPKSEGVPTRPRPKMLQPDAVHEDPRDEWVRAAGSQRAKRVGRWSASWDPSRHSTGDRERKHRKRTRVDGFLRLFGSPRWKRTRTAPCPSARSGR